MISFDLFFDNIHRNTQANTQQTRRHWYIIHVIYVIHECLATKQVFFQQSQKNWKHFLDKHRASRAALIDCFGRQKIYKHSLNSQSFEWLPKNLRVSHVSPWWSNKAKVKSCLVYQVGVYLAIDYKFQSYLFVCLLDRKSKQIFEIYVTWNASRHEWRNMFLCLGLVQICPFQFWEVSVNDRRFDN